MSCPKTQHSDSGMSRVLLVIIIVNMFLCMLDVVHCQLAVGIWASTLENLSSEFSNNKNEDQPAYTRRLISDLLFAS